MSDDKTVIRISKDSQKLSIPIENEVPTEMERMRKEIERLSGELDAAEFYRMKWAIKRVFRDSIALELATNQHARIFDMLTKNEIEEICSIFVYMDMVKEKFREHGLIK